MKHLPNLLTVNNDVPAKTVPSLACASVKTSRLSSPADIC